MRRAALFLALFPCLALGTVALRLTVPELTAQAGLVVHADVVDQRVVPERGQRGEIYTRTTLRVRRYLKGDGPSQLTVQQIGGQLGDLRLTVAGNARWAPGDEVVAFLDPDPERGLAYVVALAQGVWQVRRGERVTVERDLSGISFYGPMRLNFAPEGTTLGELTDAVRGAGSSPAGGGDVAR
jgi:hypothetical protein